MIGANVGGIFYTVELDTKKLIDGQREVDRGLQQTSGSLDAFGARLTATAAAAGVLAAALAAVKVAQLADDMRMLAARIDVAAGSTEKGAAAFAELAAIGRRTQSSLAGNAEVFARLNQSILEMGGTQQDTLQITELLGKAIKVSGASATEAKAAMLQFGQALGSGKLQGDELRSLMENAPYLMRQLADGIGVPVGALKKLGEEGKLTADVVANALSKAAQKIDGDFKKLPQTFEAAMTVAQDQAALAAVSLDNLSGGSTVLTGLTKGLGEALEEVGKQLDVMAREAGELDKNAAIESWSKKTRIVLSYVVDAVDVTWQALSVFGRNVYFVFEQIGDSIGGTGAQIAAAMRGDFAAARAIGEEMDAEAKRRRQELDAADAATLSRAKTMGQRMREAWAAAENAPQADYSNEGRNATQGTSKLKAPAQAAAKAVKVKAQFDSAGYLAGLEKETLQGYERIDAIERDALRKNEELLKAGKINREEAVQAINLIEANAATERRELQEKEDTARLDQLAEAYEKEKALKAQQDAERARDQAMARDLIIGDDPIARLQQQLAEKSETLLQAYMRDQSQEALYAEAKVALEQQTAKRIKEIREKQAADEQARQSAQLQAQSQLFDGLAGLAETFAGKQSGIYKAMFAASKAFAIAEAIVKIQQGIANASSLPFPLNIGAMASVAAATGSIVSTIKGTNYGGGRQYGGPVNAGSLYRVGEGDKPEMFMGNSGRSYMIPGERGKVVSNADMSKAGRQHVLNVTMNVASGVSRAEVAAMLPTLRAQIKAELQTSMRRPGFQGA